MGPLSHHPEALESFGNQVGDPGAAQNFHRLAALGMSAEQVLTLVDQHPDMITTLCSRDAINPREMVGLETLKSRLDLSPDQLYGLLTQLADTTSPSSPPSDPVRQGPPRLRKLTPPLDPPP